MRLAAVAVAVVSLLSLADPASASAKTQPIEGTWVLDGASGYVVQIRPFFLESNYAGTIVQMPRGTRCARQFASRPWILRGRGRHYTGIVAWVRFSTCGFLGYGEARFTVSGDGERLRTCSTHPLPPEPSLPPGPSRTICHDFVRLQLGGALGGKRVCFRYQVVGVRGSGEPLAGPLDMGDTVGATAGALKGALGGRGVGMFSLPYRAAPVSDLARDLGRPFLRSIDQGVGMLRSYLRELHRRCDSTRVALIGYSQGAAVVSEAVRRLNDATLRRVRAVVLIADPYSAGASSYALTPSIFPGGAPRRIGAGSLGPRTAALPGRTIDVCFNNDIVCDAPGGLSLAVLYQGLSTRVHSLYKSCCQIGRFHVDITDGLGADAARRLRD